MLSNEQGHKIKYIVLVSLMVILAFTFLYIFLEPVIQGFFIKGMDVQGDPTVVLNLTFDDENDPWKDYGIYNHEFDVNGDVNWVNRSYCKWYGCSNFTDTDSHDSFLNSSSKFKLDNGMAISYWVYYESAPSSSSSKGIYWIGDEGAGKMKTGWENNLGFIVKYYNDSSYFQIGVGSTEIATATTWHHYFILYDKQVFTVWRDGEIVKNTSAPYGDLDYTVGEFIRIGDARFGDNLGGYLDEFIIWNRSNFNHSFVYGSYNEKRFGTPSYLDLYVESIKYELPYDWSDDYNEIITGGNMDINFTIVNEGIISSSNFDYKFTLENDEICSGTINIPAESEVNITCSWNTIYGFQKGNITLDTLNTQSEDNEDNNIQRVYIPFLNRPWFHFNRTEWLNDILPFSSDLGNAVAYDSWDWAKSFGCSSFNVGYEGNNVDPYGKKARECAMGCFVNNYTQPEAPSKTQCDNALQHLTGWANRSVSTYDNVQALHELIHVGITYDLMFPKLSQLENDLISQQLHGICQHITNLDNTRPDLDVDDDIKGDNGYGFGSGMGGFCYSIIGAYKENPTLIQDLEQQYWGESILDEWIDREISYLRSFKNDSWSKYQERWSYKSYSQFHLVENWMFEKRYGLRNIDEYQSALCSMSRETITDTLDFNYNGEDLRNDNDQYLRGIQVGDSKSYDNPSSEKFINFDALTYYGILCDDINAKRSLLWLRDKVHTKGDGQNGYAALYLYKQLYDQAGGVSSNPENNGINKVMFDNANDILTIRTNYTYVNDTVIQIDGGEERGGGHSQAQGYYLYALGEPFMDYEQVPYNDDTRAETWKNGISLQNDTQTVEGESSFYSGTCGNADLNQYYGMKDCDTPSYSTNYPNYRKFPLQYGGDLEDYVGTSDANFAGVFVWRPYYNADDVKEYFVKFGDLLAKRTVVSNNNEGEIFHNFININDEFTETRSGINITFSRTRWDSKVVKLDINNIWSTQTLSVGGGESNINVCYAKTSCSGSARGDSKYRRTYLYTPTDNVDFIISHHWYYNGEQVKPSAIGTTDKGLQHGSNIIIYDTNNDGNSSYSDKTAVGWALAYNDNTNEIGAFNTTYIKDGNVELLAANSPLGVHLDRNSDRIILTANTMERDPYIDVPKTARVTVDAQELSQNTNFVITKNGEENIAIVSESGTKVTFDVITEQNSDYYIITGTGADVTAPTINSITNDSTTNQSSDITVTTNENANLTVKWGYSSSSLGNTAVNTVYQTSSTVSLSGLSSNSTVYYNATCCDSSGNCAHDGIYNFTTASVMPVDSGAPSVTLIINESTTNESSYITAYTDEDANLTVKWGYSADNLTNTSENTTYQAVTRAYLAGLSPNSTVYYNTTCCDSSGNCAYNGTLSFNTSSSVENDDDNNQGVQEIIPASGGGGGGGSGIRLPAGDEEEADEETKEKPSPEAEDEENSSAEDDVDLQLWNDEKASPEERKENIIFNNPITAFIIAQIENAGMETIIIAASIIITLAGLSIFLTVRKRGIDKKIENLKKGSKKRRN